MVLAIGLSIGCKREPDIVQYTIDPSMPAALSSETRMLGVIVPQESEVWFYKLTGDAPLIDKVSEEYRAWAQQVSFANGKPQFDLPDGWVQKPGSSMRFATLEIPVGEPPLEVSISSLPKNDSWDKVVMANVNRWREQLGLQPSSEQWAGAELLSETQSDEPAIWVDITGQATTGSMPPMVPPTASATATAAAPPAPIAFNKPEAWQEGKTSSMRWAAFTVGPEDKSAELTVIPAGGDLRGNIERWLGQIRPDGVTDEDVDAVISAASDVTVDGIQSQRFVMTGTGEAPQAIDATIVPLGEGFSLFIKMTGNADTVAAESERIQQFLDSLKLNS